MCHIFRIYSHLVFSLRLSYSYSYNSLHVLIQIEQEARSHNIHKPVQGQKIPG